MSKVITCSRTFPAYHPSAGQPTYFVEKFRKSRHLSGERPIDINCEFNEEIYFMCEPKHHTIREGNRFKAGDYFSPRVWGDDINPKSLKCGPYNSKQIIIGPDTLIINTWKFEIKEVEITEDLKQTNIFINDKPYCTPSVLSNELLLLSKNDGLSAMDLLHWFKYPKPFIGQIICWSESVNY